MFCGVCVLVLSFSVVTKQSGSLEDNSTSAAGTGKTETVLLVWITCPLILSLLGQAKLNNGGGHRTCSGKVNFLFCMNIL